MISFTIFQYNLINRLGWNSLTLLFRYKVHEMPFNSHENHFLYINSKKKTPQFLTSNACANSFVLCTSHWHTILSMLWLIVSSICFQKKSHQSFELCKDICSFWHHKPAVQDLLRTSLLTAPASLCEQTLRYIGYRNGNQVLMTALER